MFSNHLKIAWRHILKNKYTSLINFIGLVVGMTASIFIWQYVNYEYSYDDFHENGENIVRVRTDRVENGVPFMQFAAGAAFVGPFMKKNFPEVENYVKLTGSGNAVYSNSKMDSYKVEDVYFAMPSIFDVFSFELIKGNQATCLSEPFQAVISESLAKKFFGSDDPIGQTLIRNGSQDQKVTISGVFKDCPPNSHINFNMLGSYITFSDVLNPGGETETAPYWDGYLTYLQLKPGTDLAALEAKIPAAIEKDYDAEVRSVVELYFQPLTDIHLTSDYLFEVGENGDGGAVRFLLIIGFIILFIAWFNFINLSTARSELRAKEVGVRKVVGSSRWSLVTQFLTEAALLNFIAILVSFILVQWLKPAFEQLIDKPLEVSIFSDAQLFFVTLGALIIGTLLTGLYPAFLLSSFKPISVLKAGFTSGGPGKGNWMQRGIVVVQFMASVALIASTLIIYMQLNYMRDLELGLDIEQVLVVRGPSIVDSTFVNQNTAFKEEIRKLASVKEITNSSSVPGQSFGWTAGGVRKATDPEDEGKSMHAMAAALNYSEMFGMELVAGRYPSKEMGTDENSCILNESGAKVLGFTKPEQAIGEEIFMWGDNFTCVGVVSDFHQEYPKAGVEPMLMRAMPDFWHPEFYSIKMSTEQLAQTITQVETSWNELFPNNPFDYFFLDDHFDKQYASDQRLGNVFILFSGLAIFVSCLGLFALVAFVTERKKKEIGIRKVLGASVSNIVSLISRDFLALIVVALVIATPLAWYFMDGWLTNFAKRINIPWWTFVFAGILALAIAFATISFQSIRASLVNPVESLRSE